ncbi:hypothetical protein BGZ99_003940 [Dissophora globulifera]|uniref:Uncharacterized protein n=1 Tax=Dissophora globulifera TaxID=979702 RepID=A0A9P6RNR7_9FUNG|nr:hypothetical protein BGZ99_003940 [Dissophora globulifera]
MDHHRSPSPESDASTVSDRGSPPPPPPPPPLPPSLPLLPTDTLLLDEQHASEELSNLQEELQNVLEYVDQGMILKSFDTLSRVTDTVVNQCEKLGLASDGGAIDQKAGFWTGLNNCWLFALAHHTNARSDDQRLRPQHLAHLHATLTTWADALEKYGLVNYELGLWELRIREAMESAAVMNRQL